MKVTWHLENGMNGCDLTGEIDLEGTETDEEVEAAVREDMWNCLSLTWRRENGDEP